MAEKVEKERLDVLLVQQGLANSRELAKAYIMAGNVYVDGQKEDKAGTKVAVTAKLEVKGNQMKYVSRGDGCIRYPSGWENLSGYRRIDRRLYGLYAAKRRKQGLCH